MRMSAGVEWALHCTVLLSVLKPTSTLPGRALAQFHGVSESYLLKHMQALTRAGICESISGPTGGYRLARQPGEITLLDVFEAIEGTEPAFRCDEIRQRGPTALAPCTYTVQCGIHSVMIEAEMAWKQALRARTIADLAPRSIDTMHPERVELATRWIYQNVRRNLDNAGSGGESNGGSVRVGIPRPKEPRDATPLI
jgi:Rrf2 family protein